MTLKFSSNLYSRAAIDYAIARYKDFARIKVSKTGKAFQVAFSGMDAEFADALPGEFSNCVLLAMREGA
ncbi:MAG: HxsD-like protein [Elusimicrobiota bacterium]